MTIVPSFQRCADHGTGNSPSHHSHSTIRHRFPFPSCTTGAQDGVWSRLPRPASNPPPMCNPPAPRELAFTQS
jgi:hypothetical protein